MAEAKDKTDPAADAGAAKSPKGNLILIIIIAVLGTLLIGGGITAFVLLRHSGNTHAEVTEEATAEAPKAETKKVEAKKKEVKKKDEAKGPAIYIPLEPPFVVNFDASQTVRFLQITVELMTRDQATSQLLKENNPLVRNDLLMLFGNQDAAALTAREGKENLRKQTLDAVRNLVKTENGKPELVEAVYFTSFVMQ